MIKIEDLVKKWFNINHFLTIFHGDFPKICDEEKPFVQPWNGTSTCRILFNQEKNYYQNYSPFIMACLSGDINLCKYLIEKGCDLNVKGATRKTKKSHSLGLSPVLLGRKICKNGQQNFF